MKKSIWKEYTAKTIPELKITVAELVKEIFKIKLNRSVKKVKNLREVYHKRKDLAKLKTLLREKELIHG